MNVYYPPFSSTALRTLLCRRVWVAEAVIAQPGLALAGEVTHGVAVRHADSPGSARIALALLQLLRLVVG